MSNTLEVDDSVEKKRISALRKLGILDTPPDGSFDKITKLAAQLLDVPIAIVSIVDSDRIWFKSKYGLDVQEIGRDPGLCASAILSDELYLVEDAKRDVRTLTNPLVAGDFGLQFYAAVPIKTKDGYNMGTFCVIDKKPRKLSRIKKEILHNLAELVMDHMDLRIEARKAVKYQHQLLNITAHDLKNPLAIMPLLADMIIKNKENPKAIEDIGLQIKDAGKRMNNIITDLLESALQDGDEIQLRLKQLNLTEIVKNVVNSNMLLAKHKDQNIHLTIEDDCIIYADQQRITEVFDNLINNAIKYSPLGKNIFVEVRSVNESAIVEVIDEGPGLTQDDKKNLFKRFTSLSAQPTGGEDSTGLGLYIVKNLVQAHRGNISVESEGINKGTTFRVELALSEC